MEGHANENEDLTDLASQELMKAAKIIEEAVAALTATAKARANKPKPPTGEVDVAEAILDASLAISRATATLVQSAAQAQKEFVAAGKASANPSTFYAKSRTFSEGMISAAQAVAAATAELVKQANGVATGKFEVYRLDSFGIASYKLSLSSTLGRRTCGCLQSCHSRNSPTGRCFSCQGRSQQSKPKGDIHSFLFARTPLTY